MVGDGRVHVRGPDADQVAQRDWRGGAELALMRRIKDAIDPRGLMNPGKVLP